jgi:predicted RNA binding protein YcfA (HicA-like mRNA interferase family)
VSSLAARRAASSNSIGFVQVRHRGDHVVMQRRFETTTITVPVPDHRELRIGTLLSIIRQSQLPARCSRSDPV